MSGSYGDDPTYSEGYYGYSGQNPSYGTSSSPRQQRSRYSQQGTSASAFQDYYRPDEQSVYDNPQTSMTTASSRHSRPTYPSSSHHSGQDYYSQDLGGADPYTNGTGHDSSSRGPTGHYQGRSSYGHMEPASTLSRMEDSTPYTVGAVDTYTSGGRTDDVSTQTTSGRRSPDNQYGSYDSRRSSQRGRSSTVRHTDDADRDLGGIGSHLPYEGTSVPRSGSLSVSSYSSSDRSRSDDGHGESGSRSYLPRGSDDGYQSQTPSSIGSTDYRTSPAGASSSRRDASRSSATDSSAHELSSGMQDLKIHPKPSESYSGRPREQQYYGTSSSGTPTIVPATSSGGSRSGGPSRRSHNSASSSSRQSQSRSSTSGSSRNLEQRSSTSSSSRRSRKPRTGDPDQDPMYDIAEEERDHPSRDATDYDNDRGGSSTQYAGYSTYTGSQYPRYY